MSRSFFPDWQALALVAVAVGGPWAVNAWRKRRAQSWPVVQGRVAATSVLTEMEKYTRRPPELCYSYEVNGKHYYGVHEIFETDFGTYPPGSPILVHYKPSDPSVSRLDVREMREREDSADERTQIDE